MGNQAVYSEGLFIEPNKIKKPQIKFDAKKLDIQNVFGKIDIPSARAQKADDTVVQSLKSSFVTRIQHYQNINQLMKKNHKISIKRQKSQRSLKYQKSQKQVLAQIEQNEVDIQTNINIPATHDYYIQQRKAKTEVACSKANFKVDMEKYMTRNDSPIKQQNRTPAQSQILVFQSRLQNKYFKITK